MRRIAEWKKVAGRSIYGVATPLLALLLVACANPAPPARSADEWQPAVPNPNAPYPPESRQNGEQGQVLLRVLTDAEGRPTQVEVQQSSGYPRLDKSAVDTVRRWQFKPLPQTGAVVWREVPIRFFINAPLFAAPMQ